MTVTMILPALTEATSPFFRPINYSLFPPLGLATLAGYLPPDVEVTIHDEHVEPLSLDDDTPDPVVIQVLSLGVDGTRGHGSCRRRVGPAARRLCRRLEEVRATVGRGDSRPTLARR